jgi:hypothetical protein
MVVVFYLYLKICKQMDTKYETSSSKFATSKHNKEVEEKATC